MLPPGGRVPRTLGRLRLARRLAAAATAAALAGLRGETRRGLRPCVDVRLLLALSSPWK